jgi:hypothetical protein
LVILYEQEILRCFLLSSREKIDQTIPFSFCSIIKDDEIYSQFKNNNDPISTTSPLANVTQENINSVPNQDSSSLIHISHGEPLNSEEKLVKYLSDLRFKFQKLKDDLIKRQLHESDSLYAVQKMDFESIVRDLTNKYKIIPGVTTNTVNGNILTKLSFFKQNETHVPIVHVNSKFELFENVI